MDATRSPTGQRNCNSSVMANDEWLICQPCGNGNLKGRGGFAQQVERNFCYCLQKVKTFSSLTLPPTAFEFKSWPPCLALTWCLFGIPQTCPCPPNHHFYFRWRAEVYGGTRNLPKLPLQSPLPPRLILLAKHKLILRCCSTWDSAKCSTVTTAQ